MLRIQAKSNNVTNIDIFGDIGQSWFDDGHTMQSVSDTLKSIEGDININLSSLGGDVSDGLGIHDLIKAHKGKVTVNVIGATASSGTIVALGGDEINMSENALWLVHNARTSASGTVKEFEQAINDLKVFDSRIISIYKSKTNKPEAEIEALMAEDKWITAQDALEFGFINSVYKPMKAAAKYDNNKVVAAGLPPLPAIYQNNMENIETTVKDKILAAIGFKNDETILAENATLKQDAIQAKADYDSAVAAKQTEIEASATKIQDLEAAVTAKGTEVTNLTAEIATLNDKIVALKADNDALMAGQTPIGGSDPKDPQGQVQMSEGEKILAQIFASASPAEKAKYQIKN